MPPADIEAILANYEAQGAVISRGPKAAEELAMYFTEIVRERTQKTASIPVVPMSAFAMVFYRQAFQSYLVGLDLPCLQTCMSACEAILRDMIHDACSTTQQLDLLDQTVLIHTDRMTLVPLADCAHELGLISKQMRDHLAHEIAPFRNPFSHGNGTQLLRRAAGKDFAVEAKKMGVDLSDQGSETLSLESRVLLAPLVEKLARESSLTALRLGPELYTEAAASLKKLHCPVPFPRKHTEEYKNEQRAARRAKETTAAPT